MFAHDPDTVKRIEKVRDNRIKEVEAEMQRQLEAAQQSMEKELAELDKKQQECAPLAGEPSPAPPPPVAEKPGGCPEDIVQYWQNKIRQARASRDKALQQLEARYNADTKTIFDECKAAQAKLAEHFKGPVGPLMGKQARDEQQRHDDACEAIAKTKLALLRDNYRDTRNNTMKYWREIINDLEASLKACRKP